MKANKVKHIIPRIYSLHDVWFIRREYYIKKLKFKRLKKSTIYFLFEYVLMMLIWLIAGLLPIKTPDDVIKMFF